VIVDIDVDNPALFGKLDQIGCDGIKLAILVLHQLSPTSGRSYLLDSRPIIAVQSNAQLWNARVSTELERLFQTVHPIARYKHRGDVVQLEKVKPCCIEPLRIAYLHSIGKVVRQHADEVLQFLLEIVSAWLPHSG
jgi:hypothetical protein